MALYDLEDLFETITNENRLETLIIANNSKDKGFKITIPRSIGKLTNLEGLTLNGCVDSLPEEIGMLSNLEYLTLPNNPNLKVLPNSISNLDNIQFVNLQNNQTQLPDWWESKFETFEESTGLWVRKD